MERKYWIGRKRAAMDMAQRATGSEARLIHYQLAGLYSIRAAQSPPPFMLPNKGPATVGEGGRIAGAGCFAPAPAALAETRSERKSSMSEQPKAGGPAPQMRFTRSRQRHGPILSRDEQVRQGRVVNAARIALVSTDAVKAFLNTHHDGLNGRPIDLATRSSEGLVAVEAVIDQQLPRAARGEGSQS